VFPENVVFSDQAHQAVAISIEVAYNPGLGKIHCEINLL
jgi:hypothetical protein